MYRKTIGALLAVGLLAACSSSDKDQARTGSSGTGDTAGIGGPGGSLASGGDKIFFDLDQSVVRADARPILDAQAEWLKRNPSVNVTVAGDCDERGTEEYNLALGNRRAYAAASYLAVDGVASSRIQTISYGKDRPLAPASTEEAWAQNRNAITSVR